MLALLAGVIAGYQTSKMVTMQLVLLRPGENSTPLTKNLQEVAMKRHLEGLEALWSAGKAVAVGPMEGSDYAGLAVMDVNSADEAKDLMKDDPFVKSGRLKVDVLPWMLENTFRKGKKFLDVEKVYFGILERPDKAPSYPNQKLEEMQAGHLANIQKMAKDGILAAAGPFLSNEKRRGVFVFCTNDLKVIQKAVAVDPLIRAKRLELKLYPWWTSKGTVVPYKP
ncbi:MAG: hypothetical protein GC165_03140 [Armatimonadetes bacterium]|nr:hypothetical protein [Armatimonadota bacterium]MBS1726722.1 hypothetical protein [Armatimonadota bacterium]